MEIELFTKFALSCINSSFSQNIQDLWGVWENLDGNYDFFVEFGALGGINVSNSYLMELCDWDGIVAEPHPAYKSILRDNRKCHVSNLVVYSESNDEVVFRTYKGKPARSTISRFEREDEVFDNKDNFKEHRIKTISLMDLLKQYGSPSEIGFISIDTEGSEFEILRAVDFNEYKFRTICVEYGTEKNRRAIFELLSNQGYIRKFVEISGHDDWYVNESLELSVDKKIKFQENFISKIGAYEHDLMERAKRRNIKKLQKNRL